MNDKQIATWLKDQTYPTKDRENGAGQLYYSETMPKILNDFHNMRTEKPYDDRRSILSFEVFWQMYDLKIDIKHSRIVYKRICEVDRAIIKVHIVSYVNDTPDPDYRQIPSRYLRNKCWHYKIKPEKRRNPWNRIIEEEK